MAIRFALALDISTDELLHPKARKVSSKKTPAAESCAASRRSKSCRPMSSALLLTTIDKFIATEQDT